MRIILAAATDGHFHCRRSGIENKMKKVLRFANKRRIVRARRPRGRFFINRILPMKPAYFFDSKPALQPSRCGLALRAKGSNLRGTERARHLDF